MKKQNPFNQKRKLYPICTYRLPMFALFPEHAHEEVISGSVKMSKPLSQTHRDILDAIAAVGIRGKYKGDPYRVAILFSQSEVFKILGHKYKKNHKWLTEQLKEIANVSLEIKYKTKNYKYFAVANIIDKIAYSEKLKREDHKKHWFGDGRLFMIVFSEDFTALFQNDYVIYAKQEVIKAIIDIKNQFVKSAVRYILTHEQVNLEFSQLLTHLGLQNTAERTKRKYKSELIAYADYLQQHFGITVKKKDNHIYIFYKKDKSKVAIDYNIASLDIKRFDKEITNAINKAIDAINKKEEQKSTYFSSSYM